jgi:hypothetical protein
MKKIYLSLIILGLLFSGCSRKERMLNYIPKSEIISSLDFTKYSKRGFLITPSDYGSNYEALGIFNFTVYPEANTNLVKINGFNIQLEALEWKQKEINHQEILDFVYKTALEKGADAITHFKIRNVEKIVNDGIENVYIQGLEVEGLLIKRK